MTESEAIEAPTVLPIQLTTSQVRPVAYRILSKKHGLNLKSTGLEVLAKFLGHNFGAEWRGSKSEKFLDMIAKLWKEQDRGLFLDGETLNIVIREATAVSTATSTNKTSTSTSTASKNLSTTSASMQEILEQKRNKFDWRDYFKVVNVQNQPVYKYNPTRKHFEPGEQQSKVLGDANSRSSLFSTRYHILYDRLLRDETFQPSSFGNASTNSITMVKNMIGRNDQEFVLLGLISYGADGEWYLQDKSGKVQLDIKTRAMPSDLSYYTAGSFVICTGIYHKSIFVVDNLGPPPAERREVTRQAFGYIDFLGVHSAMNTTAPGSKTSRIDRIDKQFEQQLRTSEQQLNHKIAILGTNIYLDQLKVIDALRQIFNSLEQEPPVAIILPGSFSSVPFQPNGSSTLYKESFDFLAQLFEEFPNLIANSTFIFVPGDNDPWAASFAAGAAPSWPLSPIPNLFTTRLRRTGAKVIWASNPSRLSYLSQEIVLVRDDYGARFRRNSIVFPNELAESDRDGKEDEANAEPIDLTEENNNKEDQANEEDVNGKEEDEDEDVAANRRAIAQMVEEAPKPTKSNVATTVSPEIAEARKVVRTILDQGHLSPFPLSTRPISWQFDHALYLTPLPSMMLLADPSTPQFRVTYEGCYVVNPGQLLVKNQCNWLEYDASSGVAQEKLLYI